MNLENFVVIKEKREVEIKNFVKEEEEFCKRFDRFMKEGEDEFRIWF